MTNITIILSQKYKGSWMDVIVEYKGSMVKNYTDEYQTISEFKKNNPEYKGALIIRV